MGSNDNALFLGNLKHDIPKYFLKENVVRMLESLGVDILPTSIRITYKPKFAYAFVYLSSKQEKQHILDFFATEPFHSNEDTFNVVQLGRTLKVAPKLTPKQLYRSPKNGSAWNNHGTNINDGRLAQSNGPNIFTDSTESTTLLRQLDQLHQVETMAAGRSDLRKTEKIEMDPSVHQSFEHYDTNSKDEEAAENVNIASIRNHYPKKEQEIYHKDIYIKGESLGNENRLLEFKKGSDRYSQKQLKKHVSKYVCAFLNSEGGTLLIGVDDNGIVEGIESSHQLEDKLRLDIDEAVKQINPAVLPMLYHINFCSVMDQHQRILGNLKVLEISIRAVTSDKLYEDSEGVVWMRRDGGVQKLRAGDIQEWTRVTVLADQQRMNDKIALADQQKMNEKIENLSDRLEHLQAERDDDKGQAAKPRTLVDQTKKKQRKISKLCTIS